jgi:hypothetical protein
MVTQTHGDAKCVGWRMGSAKDRIHRGFSFGGPDRRRASVSFLALGAGFVHPAMISDSPGFVRFLGSFGFSAQRVRSCWTDRKAVSRGAYVEPGMAGDGQEGRHRAVCLARRGIGFLRALRSAGCNRFLRVSGSFGISGNSGSFGIEGRFRAVIKRRPCFRRGVVQPSSLAGYRNECKQTQQRRGCAIGAGVNEASTFAR